MLKMIFNESVALSIKYSHHIKSKGVITIVIEMLLMTSPPKYLASVMSGRQGTLENDV